MANPVRTITETFHMSRACDTSTRKCKILISGIDHVEVTPYNIQNYVESNFINVVRLVQLSGENKQCAIYLLSGAYIQLWQDYEWYNMEISDHGTWLHKIIKLINC